MSTRWSSSEYLRLRYLQLCERRHCLLSFICNGATAITSGFCDESTARKQKMNSWSMRYQSRKVASLATSFLRNECCTSIFAPSFRAFSEFVLSLVFPSPLSYDTPSSWLFLLGGCTPRKLLVGILNTVSCLSEIYEQSKRHYAPACVLSLRISLARQQPTLLLPTSRNALTHYGAKP